MPHVRLTLLAFLLNCFYCFCLQRIELNKFDDGGNENSARKPQKVLENYVNRQLKIGFIKVRQFLKEESKPSPNR